MEDSTAMVVRLNEGLRFTATTAGGFSIEADSRVDPLETPEAPSPMELQLAALGACTAMDTISILRKMRQDVTAYDVRLSHTRAAAHPRVFTAIQLRHTVRGRSIAEANVRRAIELTMTRYCPVFAMLSPTVAISERYEIIDDASGAVVGEGEVPPTSSASAGG